MDPEWEADCFPYRKHLCTRVEMKSGERSLLKELDRVVRSKAVGEQISPIVSRVRGELARKPKALMAWEPIPLNVFGGTLPAGIRSSWVFVLRAGADTGAERHPNSHQRMMSLHGAGEMRTAESGSDPRWRSNFLISDPDTPLEQRWISIPPNVWHRPVISSEMDWVVVSFHTVPAKELIEERPGSGAAAEIHRMRYLDQ
jgi:hypothetical protein